MEIEEMVKMVVFVIVLIIMAGAVFVLITGKGGNILSFISDLLRFGK